MSRLKSAAIGVPLITYACFALAASVHASVAQFWWFGCGAATAVGFVLFRLSQRSEFVGDGGAVEARLVARWLPIFSGLLMFSVGCFFIVSSLTSQPPEPWDVFAGFCLAFIALAVAVHSIRANRRA